MNLFKVNWLSGIIFGSLTFIIFCYFSVGLSYKMFFTEHSENIFYQIAFYSWIISITVFPFVLKKKKYALKVFILSVFAPAAATLATCIFLLQSFTRASWIVIFFYSTFSLLFGTFFKIPSKYK